MTLLHFSEDPDLTVFHSPDDPGFYGAFTAKDTVYPLSVEPVGDLLRAHRDARIEVRVTPSLWPLWDPLVASTLHFSGIRLRNAVPRPST
jgi:hypothetical protein